MRTMIKSWSVCLALRAKSEPYQASVVKAGDIAPHKGGDLFLSGRAALAFTWGDDLGAVAQAYRPSLGW